MKPDLNLSLDGCQSWTPLLGRDLSVPSASEFGPGWGTAFPTGVWGWAFREDPSPIAMATRVAKPLSKAAMAWERGRLHRSWGARSPGQGHGTALHQKDRTMQAATVGHGAHTCSPSARKADAGCQFEVNTTVSSRPAWTVHKPPPQKAKD